MTLPGPYIRTGGQTGVDRAALDAAILSGRPYEGWCPKGGWAEDLIDPPGLLKTYPCLKETPSELPDQRTEWNVRDSAATLIVSSGSNSRSRGTDFTIACAKRYKKPYSLIHHLDDRAVAEIRRAIASLNKEQSINIAGPRESEHPGIYDRCLAIFIEAFRRRRVYLQ